MRLDSGNLLAAKMNSHRHQWNGTICSQPQAWNCGADAAFRADYCDRGVPRCFHLDVFRSNAPRFVTPDSSLVLAVQQQPTVLDDQVLAFYGGRFGPQQGISPGDYEQTLFGVYRVKHAALDITRSPYRLVIEPYPDAWAMFPRVHLRPPTLRAVAGVAYLKQFRAKGLRDAVDAALEASASLLKTEAWSSDNQRRLQRASDALPQWLQKAEEAMARLPLPSEVPRISVSVGTLEGTLAAKLRGIRITTAPSSPTMKESFPTDIVAGVIVAPVSTHAGQSEAGQVPLGPVNPDDTVPQAEPATPAVTLLGPVDGSATLVQEPVAKAPAEDSSPTEAAARGMEGVEVGPAPFQNGSESRVDALASPSDTVDGADEAVSVVADGPSMHVVPEPRGKQELTDQFGLPLVEALGVAFITKNLVILTGAPGVGKSWIASRLLDDPERLRTVIVPVASTWRGREDLLGYVNPISANFEASEFTLFLCDAQAAWEIGDRRTRLVIFEEFNLSQPEHWLSDLLVRLEYDSERLADRTVRLGGKEIAGRPGRAGNVVLVPSLRFAATLNNDHTVKPLSPRVLDRAALIEVTSSGRKALLRAGVELGEDVEDVIDELNDLLESRGAAFSVRSARSLQRALEATSSNGMGIKKALDLVVAQEVLSRVRLLAGDPRDEQLLSRLVAWTQKPGCVELTVCAARIGEWGELLSAGRDVFQA